MRASIFASLTHLSERSASSSSMNPTVVPLVPLLSAAVTLILCLFAEPICRRLNILDIPDARKQHAHPTPLMGGIALQLAALPSAVIAALFLIPRDWTPHVLVWVGAVAAMTLVGLADDRHTLSARDRLLVSFLVFGSAATIDSIFNVRVLVFEYPLFKLGLGTGWLAIIFTMICCVGLVNAVNMADGKNGLVIGLCLGWLGLLAFRSPPPILPVIAIVMAAWAVLLVFNLHGKLFLGDGGSYGIATAIGLLAIISYNSPGGHAGRAISAGELMLLFSIPVLDSFRLAFTRLRQGRSPMSADRDHLHHHLLQKFGWPGGLVTYWGLALLPYSALQVTALIGLAILGAAVVAYCYAIFGS